MKLIRSLVKSALPLLKPELPMGFVFGIDLEQQEQAWSRKESAHSNRSCRSTRYIRSLSPYRNMDALVLLLKGA
jgi:hypothetical protein